MHLFLVHIKLINKRNMKQNKQAQSLAQIAAIHQQLDELETCIREQQLTERRWTFPKDSYTVLAIWLLYDPVAHELFVSIHWSTYCRSQSFFVSLQKI